MNDLIDRQAAIDVLEERLHANGYSNVALVSELNRSIGYLMRLPSAKPEPCEDAVSRADVVDMLEMYPFTEYSEYEAAREVVKQLPSAQPLPEIIRCKDCEYRGEKPISDGLYRCEINNSFMYCRKEN